MEGNIFDIFRVVSLVVVWAIPAILILAVVAFVIAAPAVTLAGVVLRLYDVVRDKLRVGGPSRKVASSKKSSMDG